MTQELPSIEFTQRAELNRQIELKYLKKCSNVGWLRLLIFCLGAGGSFYLFRHDQNGAGWITLLSFYVLFLVVMKWHQRLRYTQHHHSFLKEINLEETERLQGKITGFDSGDRYRDSQHLYTADLDIFGSHSLFQLVNRAVTSIGKDCLAEWLKNPAPAPEIVARQEAVAELAPQIEWRQKLQAKAMHYKQTAQNPYLFFDWLHAPDFYRDKIWLKPFIFILPVLTIGALVARWYLGPDVFPFYIAATFMFLQYLLNVRYRKVKEDYYEQSSGMYEVLQSYTALLAHIETHSFRTKKLSDLKQLLQFQHKTASAYLNDLSAIIQYLSAHLNVYMNLLLNSILMWDYFWMFRLESWKKTMVRNLKPILETVAEMEALCSFAAFKYAHPEYALPEISQQPFEVKATDLGHPLIFSDRLITNNFLMAGAGQTIIITGSNMSGKSTFLRTVAINMVLAFSGSVVNARHLRVFPAQVYTAMRTEDNLAESTSSFYAELKRLKMLLDLTATGTAVYYFLDEILKGTNSRDRHLGAQALIRQLHIRNASGLISTHDLELGQMESQNPDYIQNYSFNSTISGNQILFDYKLHPGVCNSFNASKLMQQMGIDL